MSITNYGGIYNYSGGGGYGSGGGGGNSKLILLDASNGPIDYFLPSINYSSSYITFELNIIKTDNSSNTITIKTPQNVTIQNGTTNTTYILKHQNETVRIVPSSSNSYRRI